MATHRNFAVDLYNATDKGVWNDQPWPVGAKRTGCLHEERLPGAHALTWTMDRKFDTTAFCCHSKVHSSVHQPSLAPPSMHSTLFRRTLSSTLHELVSERARNGRWEYPPFWEKNRMETVCTVRPVPDPSELTTGAGSN